tara:strand:- start:204 stop:452 length:249 start_codon:yes stop_codon:yes gene_type:complete
MSVIESPTHYKQSIECWDAMEAMMDEGRDAEINLTPHICYLWGNVFKYLWRWPYKKRPVEDLRKARAYLDRLIERSEIQTYD